MVHLTEVREAFDEVYDLEPHAEGFWTGPMGYCWLVVFLWDAHGQYFGSGRGHHCAGGLTALRLDKLRRGLDGRTDVLIVVVQGMLSDQLESDSARLKELQDLSRTNNWNISRFKVRNDSTVVTRYGRCLPKDDFEAETKVEAENLTKCRCIIL